ncbi:MAG: lysophospholipid acyltransferase family protein [Gemmataceae bacterium]
MKLRNPRLINMAAWVAAKTIRNWIRTLRLTYVSLGPNLDPRRPDIRDRYVFTFWHDMLLLPAHVYGFSNIHVLISRHADGQLIASTIERLGFGTVRGSSSRGGVEAMREMTRIVNSAHVAITPDGPRGPRRQIQPGAVYLASRTGLPLAPYGLAFDRPWRVKSWDQFALPRPFSRACVVTGEPIFVPADADREALEHYRILLQNQMDYLTERAEQLAVGQVPERNAA